jgi:2-amino-4-hydroxy-6-hydroxymethyldihydropteridine diphosphokinase
VAEARVFLGLGANLGDPLARLAEAVGALRAAVEVDAVSSVFRTEPVGFRDQPDFFNLVVAGTTRLEPADLLRAAHDVEARLGRVRSFRNAPREIDVDLLAYGDLVIRTAELSVPHPGIAARGFVLHPLAEIAPEWRHPVLGKTARQLLAEALAVERVELVGPLPGPPGTRSLQ